MSDLFDRKIRSSTRRFIQLRLGVRRPRLPPSVYPLDESHSAPSNFGPTLWYQHTSPKAVQASDCAQEFEQNLFLALIIIRNALLEKTRLNRLGAHSCPRKPYHVERLVAPRLNIMAQ